MGDVLSQDEIDRLLAGLSTGELDVDEMQDKGEKQVKNYDFKRPAKFSKEHLRTLEIIHEHYGRLLATNLPVYLRKNIQVSVASSETVTFSEFSNALSNPVILGIINFQPLGGNIILDLAANCGVIVKSGAWYSYEGEKIGQGKDNTCAFLDEHPEILAKIERKTRAHYGLETLPEEPAGKSEKPEKKPKKASQDDDVEIIDEV